MNQDMSWAEDALKSASSNEVRENLTDLAQDIGHFHDALMINNIPQPLRDTIISKYVDVLFAPKMSLPLMQLLGGAGPRPESDD